MGDAALWGGSSMAVGMAANPQEAHQAGRHQVQPHAEAPQAPASQIGVPETPPGTPISIDSRAVSSWLHDGVAGHAGLKNACKEVAFFALLRYLA